MGDGNGIEIELNLLPPPHDALHKTMEIHVANKAQTGDFPQNMSLMCHMQAVEEGDEKQPIHQ